MAEAYERVCAERDAVGSTKSAERPKMIESALLRRAMILDCADAEFLDKGFHAATMSGIAARLGGSKGVLYNYFSSKEELVLASVRRDCLKLQEQMSSFALENKSLKETLILIGRRYLEVVASDDLVRKVRMILGEVERRPELGRTLFEMGPARGAATLASYLDQARRDGALAFDDSSRAASHFISLCDNGTTKARWCSAMAVPSEEEICDAVESAVRVFLAAYASQAAQSL